MNTCDNSVVNMADDTLVHQVAAVMLHRMHEEPKLRVALEFMMPVRMGAGVMLHLRAT